MGIAVDEKDLAAFGVALAEAAVADREWEVAAGYYLGAAERYERMGESECAVWYRREFYRSQNRAAVAKAAVG